MINKSLSSLSKKPENNAHVIINWSPLKRCILMLLLAIGLNILWLVWKTYIVFKPELHQLVHIDLVQALIQINILFIVVLAVLIYPCYKLQHHAKAQTFLPYICVATFVFTLMYDGYMVGLMSPATLCGMISVVAVGLVLFTPRLVYTMLAPSLVIFAYLMYQIILQEIPYAPIFNLSAMDYQPYFNKFWLGSMLYFITPIAITCFMIFDLLLKQWRDREQAFQLLSQIDPLTHLLNRRSINEYFQNMEAHPSMAFDACCIVLMDIDYFKTINDTYGHLKGDEVLVQVADVLKQNTRPEDIVGRYGGEEFIILINTLDTELAEHVAERCRKAIMNLELYAGKQKFPVTASFGISKWQAQHGSIEDALHQADVAMYQAKSAGRNMVVFAS